MSVMGVVIDYHVVVVQFDSGDKYIHQRTAIIYVVGIAFGKTFKKEFHLFVFQHRALYFLHRKLRFEVSFLILPLLNLSGNDVSSFAFLQGFKQVRDCLVNFANLLRMRLRDSVLRSFSQRSSIKRASMSMYSGVSSLTVSSITLSSIYAFFTLFLLHPDLRLLPTHW